MPDQPLTHPALDNKKTDNNTLSVEEIDTPDVADAADKPVAAGETPNPISDFVTFQEYRAPNVTVRFLDI